MTPVTISLTIMVGPILNGGMWWPFLMSRCGPTTTRTCTIAFRCSIPCSVCPTETLDLCWRPSRMPRQISRHYWNISDCWRTKWSKQDWTWHGKSPCCLTKGKSPNPALWWAQPHRERRTTSGSSRMLGSSNALDQFRSSRFQRWWWWVTTLIYRKMQTSYITPSG